MTILGHEIGEDFTKLILKDCLTEAIPSNKKDLKNYEDVISETQKFQEFLVSVGK